MAEVEGRVYDTIEEEEQPVWKSYLYQLQQKAPRPIRIICNNNIAVKPLHYGKEFHGSISREEADELVNSQDGCYLVRESQRQPGSYTLTMRFGGVSKNFRLYYDGLHYVGEKRFQTMEDLVADGLITMYMDTYAKDYIDTMMVDQVMDEHKQSKQQAKPDNGQSKQDQSDGTKQEDRRFSASKRPSFKPSTYSKEHNFKVNTYKGLHWCDYCRNFLWGLTQQGFKCQDCGMNVHKQCMRVVGKDCKPDKKYVRRVFGVDLTTLVKLHDTKRPFVVDMCIQDVEKRGMVAI
ncbi:N-chimaerin isoform X2 [Exaiptasia diaphana]|uniref:N-chimaerin n=1 Tax=Exaiptasia diaphana TaxID=2652724 RepID=A0A913XM89_EXADI|nr:N-chimaerin isoform X2 [Exaiptasia diaphana]